MSEHASVVISDTQSEREVIKRLRKLHSKLALRAVITAATPLSELCAQNRAEYEVLELIRQRKELAELADAKSAVSK